MAGFAGEWLLSVAVGRVKESDHKLETVAGAVVTVIAAW